jgi:anti-sigma B factor antagonist
MVQRQAKTSGIKISVNPVGARMDIMLLTILGYVDTTTSQELTRIMKELLDRKKYYIIADLGGVSYVSSAGWGVFVGEIKNIRDQGGDLKIVQMTPEVFEVFEMLEFNRILNYYDSIEEAIDEFDIIRGIDITKVGETPKESGVQAAYAKRAATMGPADKRKGQKGRPTLAPKDLPLIEKIKMIVVERPFGGARSICRTLKTEKYGGENLSWLKARSILKKLNLETKEKRYRYYRSR